MLDSTFELITLAASNSLVVFCFCNLIIAILLVASSKPSSEVDDEEKPRTHSLPTTAQKGENRSSLVGKNAAGKTEALMPMNVAASAASTVDIAIIDENQESQDEDEEDDELRRKVEEFIEKAKRDWKAENLRTYGLIN